MHGAHVGARCQRRDDSEPRAALGPCAFHLSSRRRSDLHAVVSSSSVHKVQRRACRSVAAHSSAAECIPLHCASNHSHCCQRYRAGTPLAVYVVSVLLFLTVLLRYFFRVACSRMVSGKRRRCICSSKLPPSIECNKLIFLARLFVFCFFLFFFFFFFLGFIKRSFHIPLKATMTAAGRAMNLSTIRKKRAQLQSEALARLEKRQQDAAFEAAEQAADAALAAEHEFHMLDRQKDNATPEGVAAAAVATASRAGDKRAVAASQKRADSAEAAAVAVAPAPRKTATATAEAVSTTSAASAVPSEKEHKGVFSILGNAATRVKEARARQLARAQADLAREREKRERLARERREREAARAAAREAAREHVRKARLADQQELEAAEQAAKSKNLSPKPADRAVLDSSDPTSAVSTSAKDKDASVRKRTDLASSSDDWLQSSFNKPWQEKEVSLEDLARLSNYSLLPLSLFRDFAHNLLIFYLYHFIARIGCMVICKANRQCAAVAACEHRNWPTFARAE